MSDKALLKARQFIQADLVDVNTALLRGNFETLYQVGTLQGKAQGLADALAAIDAALNELDDSD